MHRLLLALVLVLGIPSVAEAGKKKKIPVLIDVGLGPAFWTFSGGIEERGAFLPGMVLRVEAIVTKKTLARKDVIRRVPKQYRPMVRKMPDLHVRPIYLALVPDAFVLAPAGKDGGTSVMGGSWAPISLSLAHRVKPMHFFVRVQPRITLLSVQTGNQDADLVGHIGVAANPDISWKVAKRLWLGGGWESSLGLPFAPGDGPDVRRMIHVGRAYGMVHLRIPIKVSP